VISFPAAIYAAVNDITIEQAEREFENASYADFKKRVGEATVEALRPIREKYEKLRSDDNALCELMKSGAQKAAYIARKTLDKVYKKIGFVRV
ncbi:MAG: tryptophan--tRNA ligase, partial [Clostridiales bacterium]|nr:tryptophan--tRNA ligase [Clostridiales bacterium]